MDQPKYRIEIFWSDEDGGYIANVPDLRYCSAFGESYEEALREVLVAMELHLDTLREFGRPIPEPKTRHVIGMSADVDNPGSVSVITEEATTQTEIGEDEVSVPVTEEEVVVEKRPVAKEEVRIRKDVVEDTEIVEEDVRREEIEIDDDTPRRMR